MFKQHCVSNGIACNVTVLLCPECALEKSGALCGQVADSCPQSALISSSVVPLQCYWEGPFGAGSLKPHIFNTSIKSLSDNCFAFFRRRDRRRSAFFNSVLIRFRSARTAFCSSFNFLMASKRSSLSFTGAAQSIAGLATLAAATSSPATATPKEDVDAAPVQLRSSSSLGFAAMAQRMKLMQKGAATCNCCANGCDTMLAVLLCYLHSVRLHRFGLNSHF